MYSMLYGLFVGEDDNMTDCSFVRILAIVVYTDVTLNVLSSVIISDEFLMKDNLDKK